MSSERVTKYPNPTPYLPSPVAASGAADDIRARNNAQVARSERLRGLLLTGIGELQTHLAELSAVLTSAPCEGLDPEPLEACQVTLAAAAAEDKGAGALDALTKTATVLGTLGQDITQRKEQYAPSRALELLAQVCTGLRFTVFLASIAVMIGAEVIFGWWGGLAANFLGQCGLMAIAAGLSEVELWVDERMLDREEMSAKLRPIEAAYKRVNAELHRLKCAEAMAHLRSDLSETARLVFDDLLNEADDLPSAARIDAVLRSHSIEPEMKRTVMLGLLVGSLTFRSEFAQQGPQALRAALEAEAALAALECKEAIAALDRELASATEEVIIAPLADVAPGTSTGATAKPMLPDEATARRDKFFAMTRLQGAWHEVLRCLEPRTDIPKPPSCSDAHADALPMQPPAHSGAAASLGARSREAQLPPGTLPA